MKWALMRGNAQSDLGFVGQLLGVFLSLSVLRPCCSGGSLSNKSLQLIASHPSTQGDPSFLQRLTPRISRHFSQAGTRSSWHDCHICWGLLSPSTASAWSRVKWTSSHLLSTYSVSCAELSPLPTFQMVTIVLHLFWFGPFLFLSCLIDCSS